MNSMDDYTDEYYNNSDIKVDNIPSSNKKGNLVIIGILSLVVGVLIFLILNKKNDNSETKDNYEINLFPETITLSVGKTQEISFDVRNNGKIVVNSSIRLSSDNEEVVKVDNLNVKAIDYGKATLTATYVDSDGNTIVSKTKEVTVAEGKPDVLITDVIVPEGSLQLPFNGTYTIPLKFSPQNGYITSKKYSSSDENIAIVDNTGTVTAISEGAAIIYVDINNGLIKREINVLVSSDYEIPSIVNNPTSVKMNMSSNTFVVGESIIIKYTMEPENASTENIKWTSSDPSIATVDNNGKVTAIKEGIVTIKMASGNISDSIELKIEMADVPVTDISLITDNYLLLVGQTQTMIPTVVPDNATDKTLTFSSLNPSVASISTDTGVITAIAPGSTTITVKSNNGIEKTVTVTVTEDPGNNNSNNGGSDCYKAKSCPNGQVSNCSGKCVECPDGYYCVSNTKKKCAEGLEPNSSKTGCVATSCPAGQGIGSFGTCSSCASGYVSPVGSTVCEECKNGKVPNSDRSACITKTCPAGQGADSSSNTGCSTCKKGTYSPENDAKCYQCPSNSTTNNTGSTSAEECICADGYYKENGKCKLCDMPYYCRNNGRYKCPSKPEYENAGTTKNGATSPEDCHYSNG